MVVERFFKKQLLCNLNTIHINKKNWRVDIFMLLYLLEHVAVLEQNTFGPLVSAGDNIPSFVIHRVSQSFTVRSNSEFPRIAILIRE
jgi:hypothetical protein